MTSFNLSHDSTKPAGPTTLDQHLFILSIYHDFHNILFPVEKNHVNHLLDLYDWENPSSEDNVDNDDSSFRDFSFNPVGGSICYDDHESIYP